MTLIRSVLINYLNLYVSVTIVFFFKIIYTVRLPLFILNRLWGLRGHQQPYAGYAVNKRMDELGLQVYLYAATCWLHPAACHQSCCPTLSKCN